MVRDIATAAGQARVTGVCPVLETPFTERGEVDIESFQRLIDHVLAAGVRSIMFPGFASEFYKLTDDERAQLTAVLVERARQVPGVVVVLSIPDHASHVAEARARAAVALGADMVNILPPHQFAPRADAVKQHVTCLLEAASPTPAIVQYAPAQTGTFLDVGILTDMARSSGNLVQVKVESAPPGRLISALASHVPKLGGIVGYAGVQLIDALRRGADAVQPGSSFVEIYLRIWDLWHKGQQEEAVALHTRLLPYISYWMQSVELIIRAEKRISMLRGLIATDHCREPAYLLDDEEIAMIDRFMREFEDCFAVPEPDPNLPGAAGSGCDDEAAAAP